jgi:hypothetical protein
LLNAIGGGGDKKKDKDKDKSKDKTRPDGPRSSADDAPPAGNAAKPDPVGSLLDAAGDLLNKDKKKDDKKPDGDKPAKRRKQNDDQSR